MVPPTSAVAPPESAAAVLLLSVWLGLAGLTGLPGLAQAQSPAVGGGFPPARPGIDEGGTYPRYRIEVLAFAHNGFDPDEEIFAEEPFQGLLDARPDAHVPTVPIIRAVPPPVSSSRANRPDSILLDTLSEATAHNALPDDSSRSPLPDASRSGALRDPDRTATSPGPDVLMTLPESSESPVSPGSASDPYPIRSAHVQRLLASLQYLEDPSRAPIALDPPPDALLPDGLLPAGPQLANPERLGPDSLTDRPASLGSPTSDSGRTAPRTSGPGGLRSPGGPDPLASHPGGAGDPDPRADGSTDSRGGEGVGEPAPRQPPPTFRLLRTDELELRGAWQRLQRDSDYRPLVHGGWVQATYPPDLALPIDIARLGAVNPVGTVKLHLSRFLHVTVDLVYRAPPAPPTVPQTASSAAQTGALPAAQTGALPAAQTGAIPGAPVDVLPHDGLPAAAGEGTLSDVVLPLRYALRTQRRLRSGDVHYLDHPAMGLLVVVRPHPLDE